MGYHISSGEITTSISVENANKFMDMFLKHFLNKSEGKQHLDLWEEEIIAACKEHDFIGILGIYEYGVIQKSDAYIIEEFIGEQYSYDTEIFQLLAPYMNDGHIEIHGEDHKMWRWCFEDGKFSTKYPKVVWE